jgi:hypothetical protein
MYTVHEEEYKELTIKIVQDEDTDSPRDWDNLCTMVCFHRRYNLGDKHNFSDPQDLQDFLDKEKPFYLPIYMYDHSGITISTGRGYPFNDRWDAGQLGIIYLTRERFKKECARPGKLSKDGINPILSAIKHITKKDKERAYTYLESEVQTYDDYLTGNVYGFVVEDKDGETLDSCWGFYPDHEKGKRDYDYCLTEAKNAADYLAQEIYSKGIDKANLQLSLAL